MRKTNSGKNILALLGLLVLSISLTGCGNAAANATTDKPQSQLQTSTPSQIPVQEPTLPPTTNLSSPSIPESQLTQTKAAVPAPDIQQFQSNDSVGCGH